MVAHMDMPKIFPRQPEHLHRFLPCAQRLFQVDHESGVRDCTYHLGKELGLSAVEARHVFLAYLHTVLTAHLHQPRKPLKIEGMCRRNKLPQAVEHENFRADNVAEFKVAPVILDRIEVAARIFGKEPNSFVLRGIGMYRDNLRAGRIGLRCV